MLGEGQADGISNLASRLVEAGVRDAASESGRTLEEQWERMGDRFDYQAIEQDLHQIQLDDYGITRKSVKVGE